MLRLDVVDSEVINSVLSVILETSGKVVPRFLLISSHFVAVCVDLVES